MNIFNLFIYLHNGRPFFFRVPPTFLSEKAFAAAFRYDDVVDGGEEAGAGGAEAVERLLRLVHREGEGGRDSAEAKKGR